MKRVIGYVLGILLILYGMHIRMGGAGTWFYMVWPAAGILVILAAALTKTGILKKIPGKLRWAASLLFCLLLLAAVAGEGMILAHFHDTPDAVWSRDADYLIVLGAQVYESGPSAVLRYRLDTAAEYLNAHPQTVCIVSGGKGFNEKSPEAAVMKAYLVQQGLDSGRILVEDQSANTAQNIDFSSHFFSQSKDKVVIVTNNFHVFRAMRLAKKHGYGNLAMLSSPSRPSFLPHNMLRELAGLAKDFLCGNI